MKKNKLDLGGMTVNERLYVTELIDDFDIAVSKKDVNEITCILKKYKFQMIQ